MGGVDEARGTRLGSLVTQSTEPKAERWNLETEGVRGKFAQRIRGSVAATIPEIEDGGR